MKLGVRFAAALIAAYLLFLLIYLPAAHVIPRLPLPGNISVQGLSGTLWNGKASRVLFNGLQMDQTRWQLSFWPLLIGRAHVQIAGGDPRDIEEAAINGELTLSSSRVKAESTQIYLPTHLVISQMPMPFPVDARGRFKLQIAQADFRDKQCQQLAAQGEWINALVGGVNGAIDLGHFEADFSCPEGQLQLQVQEPNKLGLSATAVIQGVGKYQIKGRFKPDPSLPPELQQAAQFFGQPDAQGYYPIDF